MRQKTGPHLFHQFLCVSPPTYNLYLLINLEQHLHDTGLHHFFYLPFLCYFVFHPCLWCVCVLLGVASWILLMPIPPAHLLLITTTCVLHYLILVPPLNTFPVCSVVTLQPSPVFAFVYTLSTNCLCCLPHPASCFSSAQPN